LKKNIEKTNLSRLIFRLLNCAYRTHKKSVFPENYKLRHLPKTIKLYAKKTVIYSNLDFEFSIYRLPR